MLKPMILGAALLSGGAAHASGGFACSVNDADMTFDIQAGVTRGMGSPVFSLTAKAVLMDKTVAADLRERTFERQNLAQYWLDDDDLRFVLYAEREGTAPFGSLEIIVVTSGDDEGSYAGSYRFTGTDMTGGTQKDFSGGGSIDCSVE